MGVLYGLLGEKLSHSFSPDIHHLIFDKLNLDGHYKLIETESSRLKESMENLSASGYKGLNVTIPYKIQVIGLIDELSPEAKDIGSVNTIKFTKGGSIGYNTDYFGLSMTFAKFGIEIRGRKAVILGSGGAALTVIQLLMDLGVGDITLIGRNINKLKKVDKIKDFRIGLFSDLEIMGASDILINCTPCGMFPNINISPVNKSAVTKFNTVVDLIYNPPETLLLEYAKECKLKYVNGLYMLVSQAAASQEIWNDIKISSNIIDDIYVIMKNKVLALYE